MLHYFSYGVYFTSLQIDWVMLQKFLSSLAWWTTYNFSGLLIGRWVVCATMALRGLPCRYHNWLNCYQSFPWQGKVDAWLITLLVFPAIDYCFYNIEEGLINLLSFVTFRTPLKLFVTSRRKCFITKETAPTHLLLQALMLLLPPLLIYCLSLRSSISNWLHSFIYNWAVDC